jgi:hypothetical protein
MIFDEGIKVMSFDLVAGFFFNKDNGKSQRNEQGTTIFRNYHPPGIRIFFTGEISIV